MSACTACYSARKAPTPPRPPPAAAAAERTRELLIDTIGRGKQPAPTPEPLELPAEFEADLDFDLVELHDAVTKANTSILKNIHFVSFLHQSSIS